MSPIAAPASPASTSALFGCFPSPLSHSSVSFPETLLRHRKPKLREKFVFRASPSPSAPYKLSTSSKTIKLSKCHALPFDISPPPIEHDFAETITAEGDGTVGGFEDDDVALDAAENGAAVVDLSHYGRIRVSGEDRVQFLHNQSTADFECLAEGQGCDTVFVTPTARTIDIAHAWVMKNAITLVVSPVTCERIAKMLEKYIFIADKVEIADLSAKTSMFALVGPASNQIMERLNLADLIGQPYGSHKHYSVNGMPITVSVGSLVSEDGFSLLMSPNAAGIVWKALTAQGAVAMGPTAWETLRILLGRPAPDKELTDEFNVLEAGLWNAVSLNKGCYKGQETIARLVTYDGIKQKLWGIRLSSLVEGGSVITLEGKKVGKLTSVTAGKRASEPFGLGYIKRRGASAGDNVLVGGSVIGTLVEAPFLARQRPLSKNPTS